MKAKSSFINNKDHSMNRFLQTGVLVLIMVTGYPAQATDCDRVCLKDMVTLYVEAMVAHDPSRLPLAQDVRYSENSKAAELGKGIWQTLTRKSDFRQDYIDVNRQIAAAHVLLYEQDLPILYSVVLHVTDAKISGIETLFERVMPDSRFQPVMLDKPLAVMNDPVPEAKRMPRDEMVRIATFYPKGLRIGSFVEVMTPFAEQAYRIENGVYMAGTTRCPRDECPDILTQNIIKHPDIDPSVAAVDEEMGIVLLWMNFGFTNSYGPGRALVTFEAFKVWGGEIHAINAFFTFLPKDTQRGWPSTDQIAFP